MEEYDRQQAVIAKYEDIDEDEQFQKLMERHNSEKSKVNNFEDAHVPKSFKEDAENNEEHAQESSNEHFENEEIKT
jgi:hypothetical protein